MSSVFSTTILQHYTTNDNDSYHYQCGTNELYTLVLLPIAQPANPINWYWITPATAIPSSTTMSTTAQTLFLSCLFH